MFERTMMERGHYERSGSSMQVSCVGKKVNMFLMNDGAILSLMG